MAVALGRALASQFSGKEIPEDSLKHLNKILHKSLKPQFTSTRPGDVRHTLADISKSKRLLGFKTKVDFEEGLKKTFEHFKK